MGGPLRTDKSVDKPITRTSLNLGEHLHFTWQFEGLTTVLDGNAAVLSG